VLPLIPRGDGAPLLWAPPPAAARASQPLMLVSHENGFLPLGGAPVGPLPREFAALDALLARLPALLRGDEAPDALAREVEALAPLDADALAAAERDPRALHALLRDLAVLVSALVVEPKAKGGVLGRAAGGAAPPRDRVPAVIARPFARLCASAGMPMIMEYSSYCLTNARPREGAGAGPVGGDTAGTLPLCSWRWQQLRLHRCFDGGPEEATFVLVHAEMEARCGPLVEAYARIVRALGDAWAPATQAGAPANPQPRTDIGAVAPVLSALHAIKTTTDALLVSMLKMFNASDPRLYVSMVRPWIFGWQRESADFPRGVVFEGCGEGGADLTTFLRGETGAQSTIVPSREQARVRC
jgi:hypothetical protein